MALEEKEIFRGFECGKGALIQDFDKDVRSGEFKGTAGAVNNSCEGPRPDTRALKRPRRYLDRLLSNIRECKGLAFRPMSNVVLDAPWFHAGHPQRERGGLVEALCYPCWEFPIGVGARMNGLREGCCMGDWDSVGKVHVAQLFMVLAFTLE